MASKEIEGKCGLSTEKAATTSEATTSAVAPLQLRHMIGFNGLIRGGLIVHISGRQLIYAVGLNIVVEDLSSHGVGKQELLEGHTGPITVLALSCDGRFLASAQETQQESKAQVILWEWCTKEKLMVWPLHKGTVESLAFTCYTKHFISLGGQDDGCVAVWSAKERKPLIYKVAQLKRVGIMHCIATSKIDDGVFATAGDSYGRIWTFEPVDATLAYVELSFYPVSRVIICMEMVDQDNSQLPLLVAGTSTGDVTIFHARTGVIQCVVPNKPFSQGITALTYVRMIEDRTFAFLLGTGSGKVGYYKISMQVDAHHKASGIMKLMEGIQPWRDERDNSAVTSITKVGAGHQFFVGTKACSLYRFNLSKWTSELVRTCSRNPIHGIAFPRGTDELMVTGELELVRVFNLRLLLEVRRYVRNGRTCLVVVLNHDGTCIFTGWDNGETIVLGFEPKELSLKELYRIDITQKQPVTALALTSKSDVLVSGGNDGQCRVWRLIDDLDKGGRRVRQGLLLHQMVDHCGPITMVKVSERDNICVTSSIDGTAVIFDLDRGVRKLQFKMDMGFNAVCFCSQELHIITCGTDGKIYYYDTVTGASLRVLDACKYGPVYSLDVEKKDGLVFASCADDCLIKLWLVSEGEVTHAGTAHSDKPLKVVFGPCGTILVTGGKDGAICIWENPKLM